MNSSDSQTEPKKRSRRFYLILSAAVLLLTIIHVVFLDYVGRTNYGPGPVEIEVTTDKPFYLQGEEVHFIIYINNPQDWPVTYPDFVGYDIEKDGLSIDSGDVNIDFPPNRIPTFPAHSKTSYSPPLSWDQKMYLNGTLVQVEPGNYTLTISLSGIGYSNSGNCTVEIR